MEHVVNLSLVILDSLNFNRITNKLIAFSFNFGLLDYHNNSSTLLYILIKISN